MTQNFNLENLDDATVYDQDNEKVGSVKEIYLTIRRMNLASQP